MKARVKATGEVIEVNKVTGYNRDFEVLVYYKGDDGFPYKEEQLDFEDLTQGKADVKEKSLPKDEPDYWEKLKHQYAGMAMQGLLSNSAYLENFMKYSVEGDSLARVVSTNAIDYATALVNRLKEDKL
jgi:hypothetical protein